MAGTEYLENAAQNEPMGTVNNCGSGFTPWGTYLTCEENFNGYFGYNNPDYVLTEKQERYGFSADGFGYGWHVFDERFDISNPDYANEHNRFGWIVEIDPQNPNAKPVKHTALGNFKHEAIAIREAGGRVHCYMGDDQRFDYCYKFVSKDPWRDSIARGVSPLAEGTLFVARFHSDGTGEWLPLARNQNPLLTESFANQAELLLNTRVAADIVGATPMDRPEWSAMGPDGDTVFWTLTNNSRRETPNVANLEAPNSDGHIIRTRDLGDGIGRQFKWDFFALASQSRDTEEVYTDPDAAYVDPAGRLFIGTDGGQPDGLQDQLTVFDTTQKVRPGEAPQGKRLFVGVASDEITGFTLTPNRKTAMINMQHPGNGDPTATNFPAPTDGVTIPRDCTIVLTKKDGRVIGS